MYKLTFLLLFVAEMGLAQSNALLNTINQIEFNQDTITSVYNWVTKNIRYDVKKLNQIENRKRSTKDSGFNSQEEYERHLLTNVIKSKKGVCEDYALLFNEIVKSLGYEAYVVEGYTKDSKGKVNKKIGHAWNAVKVKGTWLLLDATWGSGHIKNGNRFVKDYSLEWYNVAPEEMLKSHLPFDPLWQLSQYPMSYKEFENNIEVPTTSTTFDYNQILEGYIQKGKQDQLRAQLNRSAEMGDGIHLIDKWRRNTKENINYHSITSQQDVLEEANITANKAVDLFNEYIKARSKKFKGKRYSREAASKNLLLAKDEATIALGLFQSINIEDRKAVNIIKKAVRNSQRLLGDIDKGLAYLDR